MNNLIVCAFVTIVFTTCNNRFENESSVISAYDTVLSGYPSMAGIKPYSKERTTVPIIYFVYDDTSGVDFDMVNHQQVYYIDETKPMMAQIVGFRDKHKHVPLQLVGDEIQVDSVASNKEYYTVKLLEDTVVVDMMLDFGRGKIKMLSYPKYGDTTSVLHDSAGVVKVGYCILVRLKK